MITRIREVRKARNMTLDDVARRCVPPTTAQTVGRLETGMRTVSVGWLNRIAKALGVDAADLVNLPDRINLEVVATLAAHGAAAPRRALQIVAPRSHPGQVAITVSASIGEYRAGDELWCDRLETGDYGRALNRDVLVPRPAGRFLFGRLIGREAASAEARGGKLQLLPLGAGGRQTVIADPPWIAVATKLIRSL